MKECLMFSLLLDIFLESKKQTCNKQDVVDMLNTSVFTCILSQNMEFPNVHKYNVTFINNAQFE